jgi:hypothetical protein
VSGEDPTEPLDAGDDPTEPMPAGGDDPTEPLEGGTDPTQPMPAGGEDPTEALEPRHTAEAGATGADPGGTEGPRESWAPHQPEARSGTGILVASIVASLALFIAYAFAGGFDFKPAAVADPCDSRVWSDPSGLEDTAQQLALSAVDGAACELDVSREQLTRALADDQTLSDFLDEEGISREQFEQAVRSGLERAVDDAENAGAIDPLVATGIRTAIGFVPVDRIIPLLQNASGLIDGGSELNELLQGDLSLEELLGGGINLEDLLGGGSGGGSDGQDGGSGGGLEDLIPDNLPQDLKDLRDQLPPEIERNLPEGIEDDIGKQLQNGLENLLGG